MAEVLSPVHDVWQLFFESVTVVELVEEFDEPETCCAFEAMAIPMKQMTMRIFFMTLNLLDKCKTISTGI